MQPKLILIFASILALISIQVRSQKIDTVKSVHPKMDKFYPQPVKTRVIYAADSNSTTPTRPVTNVQAAPLITNSPTNQNTVVNPAPQVKPNTPAPVEPQTTPAVTSSPVAVQPSNTTVNNSTTVTTPAPVTVNKPVLPKPVAPASHYVDPASLFTTRLGSSSPQYDTWEKNNNGAGAVTTHSK